MSLQSSEIKTRRIFTVSEITQDIKLILESNFAEVWVEGEVSNFRQYPSGHDYLSLKDQAAILTAVIFNRNSKEIKFKIEDGLKVICLGKVEVYAPRGQYQLIIEKIEPKGIGSLQLALEQLKQKLEKEGLFSLAHKRPIPYLPSRIGVVTSLSGAAIKDVLKVLERRFKDVHIIINPVRVQGENAKEEIALGIKDFNDFNSRVSGNERIEVMIVGRGGGSTEDLWAFNEEVVARAIYHSQIPVISAVGHERDVTIADLVADLRAATPSVAAEIVIPKKEDLKDNLDSLIKNLKQSFLDLGQNFQDTIDALMHRLRLKNPVVLIDEYQERARDFARQIYVRMTHFMELKQSEFTKAIEKLSGLSPLNILARGYSITFKMADGAVIKEAKAIKAGEVIKTRLHKGEILSQVREVH